jgi:hypothetical protein
MRDERENNFLLVGWDIRYASKIAAIPKAKRTPAKIDMITPNGEQHRQK